MDPSFLGTLLELNVLVIRESGLDVIPDGIRKLKRKLF